MNSISSPRLFFSAVIALVLASASLLTAGCSSPGYMPSNDVAPLVALVVERHDAWIKSTAPPTMEADLKSSAKLLELVAVDEFPRTAFEQWGEPVFARHDHYAMTVAAPDYDRKRWLNSTKILRLYYPPPASSSPPTSSP